MQAESTLISAAGTLKLTASALDRAKGLYAITGIAQKDYEQAVSDRPGCHDTAALFQALGGGWWNRADPTVAAATAHEGAAG